MAARPAALALSARDGTVLADRATLAKANPELAALLPDELKFYTWADDVVVTLADARRVRITAPGFGAEAYEVRNQQQFDHARQLSSTWNGGHGTDEFGVRHGRFGDAWLGLFSDAEARAAENDKWGYNYLDSADVSNERELARRTFWRATTGFTDAFNGSGRQRGGVEGICDQRIDRIEADEDAARVMSAADIEAAWHESMREPDPEIRLNACTSASRGSISRHTSASSAWSGWGRQVNGCRGAC